MAALCTEPESTGLKLIALPVIKGPTFDGWMSEVHVIFSQTQETGKLAMYGTHYFGAISMQVGHIQ